MSAGIQNRIGQYLYADGALRTRVVDGTTYKVGIAGAYDAYGLIGPEHNGIFILNGTDRQVVLDRDTPESSGYNGPSLVQWERLKDVMQCSDADFIRLINTHPRSRIAYPAGDPQEA